MTQEVLDCLREEQNEEINPSGLRPPPLTQGRPDAEGTDACAQTESAASSAPAGHLPLEGKADSGAVLAARRGEEENGAGKQPPMTPRREQTGEHVPDLRMLREHLALLREQAAQIPGFDLNAALRDPAFVRLTAPGVGVPAADAWYALHREEQERRRAEESRAILARAAAVNARRPREGGGTGAALIASDYRSLSRAEQLRVKKRIFEAGARGEKIYP